VTILFCKDCNRYLQPPKHWVRAELESKELLTFCLKRIKGLAVGGAWAGGGAAVRGRCTVCGLAHPCLCVVGLWGVHWKGGTWSVRVLAEGPEGLSGFAALSGI
jgi:hypothetical protein